MRRNDHVRMFNHVVHRFPGASEWIELVPIPPPGRLGARAPGHGRWRHRFLLSLTLVVVTISLTMVIAAFAR
jgi:hypothetical protein